MISLRAVCLCSLGLLVAPLAAARAQQAYPVCMTPLAVGEVPNTSFVAEIVADAWMVQPDGTRRMLPSSRSVTGVIARDSKGRVIVRMARTSPDGGVTEAICDPKSKSIIRLTTFPGVIGATGVPQDHGMANLLSQIDPPMTTLFAKWHQPGADKENLGQETIEGLPAYRFRLDAARKGVLEVRNADELNLQLDRITWINFSRQEQQEFRLVNIRRVEPAPSLYELPSWAFEQIYGSSAGHTYASR